MRIHNFIATSVQYFSMFTFILVFYSLSPSYSDAEIFITPERMKQHQNVIDEYFSVRNTWVTSNLGSYLFKYKTRNPPSYKVMNIPDKGYYSILIWRHWEWLKMRHVDGYGNKPNTYDPLVNCSVSNCKFKGNDDTLLSIVDAVVVNLDHGVLPDTKHRRPFQRWIFWTDESPKFKFHLSSSGHKPRLWKLANMFNWSMSYRSDSDIPVPYGRTIPLPYPKLKYEKVTDEQLKNLVPYWDKKRTDILAVILMSHCFGIRMRFIKRMRRFLNVDVIGKCAAIESHKNRCPGLYKRDCPALSEYLFYIVIENSNCRQYITEKVFHNAYSKGAIPIIMGTPLEDCNKLLPPNSFIHMVNFVTIKDLAREIYAISNNLSKLLSYHAWRNDFETVEEHGFLNTRSLALCRLCEALNYNDRSRLNVYKRNDIALYLDTDITCFRNHEWR